jgi:hypothetical protein
MLGVEENDGCASCGPGDHRLIDLQPPRDEIYTCIISSVSTARTQHGTVFYDTCTGLFSFSRTDAPQTRQRASRLRARTLGCFRPICPSLWPWSPDALSAVVQYWLGLGVSSVRPNQTACHFTKYPQGPRVVIVVVPYSKIKNNDVFGAKSLYTGLSPACLFFHSHPS